MLSLLYQVLYNTFAKPEICIDENKVLNDGKVEIIRKANEIEMGKIDQAWNCLKNYIKDSDNIEHKRIYFHIHLNGKDTDAIPASLMNDIKDICQNILREQKREEYDNYKITAIGFLTIQSGSDYQYWHQDYQGNTGMVFLNLTEETENNSTKFLDKYQGYSISYQFITSQHLFTYIPIGQWHRGIVNNENFRRNVFNFVFQKKINAFQYPYEKVFETSNQFVITVDGEEQYTVLKQ